MKKLALAAALAVSVSPVAAKFDGAYVGLSGGWAVAQGETSDKHVVHGTNGVLGGAHVGFDKTFNGQWLGGVEANADYSDQKAIHTSYGASVKLGRVLDQHVAVGVIAGWKNTKIKAQQGLFSATQDINHHFNAVTGGAFISTMITHNVELTGQYTRDFYNKKSESKIRQDGVRLKLSYKM